MMKLKSKLINPKKTHTNHKMKLLKLINFNDLRMKNAAMIEILQLRKSQP